MYASKYPRKMLLINPPSQNQSVETFNTRQLKGYIDVGIFSLKNFVLVQLHFLFYKQLGSGLMPQSCLYFQGFQGSKLLSSCLVVWSSNLYLQGIQQISGFKIETYDQWFWNFPINAFEHGDISPCFETAEFWCIVGVTTILRLLQRKNSPFLYFIVFIVA